MKLREHGTNKGYALHRYYKEEACKGCKAAHAEEHAERRYLEGPGLDKAFDRAMEILKVKRELKARGA